MGQSSEVDHTNQVICTVQTAETQLIRTATATHTSTSTATLVPATCPKPTGLSFDLLSGGSVIISWGPVDFQPSGFPTAFVEFAAATVMTGGEEVVTLRTTGADSYRLESSGDDGDYTTILDGNGDIDTDRVSSPAELPERSRTGSLRPIPPAVSPPATVSKYSRPTPRLQP